MVELFGKRMVDSRFSSPFVVMADMSGKGTIRVKATVDDGGGLCAIDMAVWAQWEGVLGGLCRSDVGARVGNGTVITSRGSIPLRVNVKGIASDLLFEVLDSGGAFEVLLGKPWLGQTRAIHDYESDTLYFRIGCRKLAIENMFPMGAGQRRGSGVEKRKVNAQRQDCPEGSEGG
jgi:hypothetical protein